MQLAFKPKLTTKDCLAGEQLSDIRHEYVDCQVYAMTGAGEAHNLIAGNVFAKLRSLVRGGPCQMLAYRTLPSLALDDIYEDVTLMPKMPQTLPGLA